MKKKLEKREFKKVKGANWLNLSLKICLIPAILILYLARALSNSLKKQKNKIWLRTPVTLLLIGIIITVTLVSAFSASDINSFFTKLFSSKPKIIATIDPIKVIDGETITITAFIEDEYGIDNIEAQVFHEKGYDILKLNLIGGNNKEGIYQAKWVCHDAKNEKWYDIIIKATNIRGKFNTVTLEYQDPTVSHPASQVTNGTFDSGNFVFPNKLTVDSNFTVNNSNLFVDTSTGNVGIGTTSPSQKLEVVGHINVSGNITDNSGRVLTIPSGMISLFDTDCPGGWTRLTALDGKFLVGGSSYNSAAGGSDSITLAEANLPSHTHGTGTLSGDSAGAHSHTATVSPNPHSHLDYNGVWGFNGVAPKGPSTTQGWNSRASTDSTSLSVTISNTGAHTHTISGSTGATGSGTAFDNRPAYATIVVCKKD